MNLNEVKKALPFAFEANLVPLLIGVHGVGKSTCVREYTEENNIGFIDLRLGQMEVGDLLGLPEITTDKNGDKITVFARPKWFPTEGSGVLFLDEINRSKRDVIQAVFQLVLDRKLHDYKLPEGWRVTAAMNPSTEDYQTLDLSDKAFLDRFCHIKISSSYQDFISYGETKSFDKSVTGFINNHPGMLRGANTEFNLNNVEPSDRSWAAVSRLVKNKNIPDDTLNELVAGLVGLEAATAFLAYKKTVEKPVSGALVLKDYKKVKKEIVAQTDVNNYRPDLINETKQQIMDIIKGKPAGEDPFTDKEYKNLVAFMIDLPNDLFIEFNRQCLKTGPKLFLKLADESDKNKDFENKITLCELTKEELKTSESTETKVEVANK